MLFIINLLITGAVLGAALLGLSLWMRSRNISLKWYEWLIGIVGILLLLFTVQNFIGSFGEMQATAAWMFLLVTGLPSLILIAITWQLARRRRSTA